MDVKRLFARLEQSLDDIRRSRDVVRTLRAIVERLVDELGDELGLVGARIYRRDDDGFELVAEVPESGRSGLRIPVSYAPVQELLQQGWVLHDADDPGVDVEFETSIGVRTFAAIYVGREIVAFSLRPGTDREQLVYTLNTIRHALNLKLNEQRLGDRLAEARTIQLSLLPSSPPRFAEYDIAGRSEPAEEVGGDLFDFIRVSKRSLGVAVADSAGHGLPAALQARDAIIGLRVGVEERWRITATIEKLNRVIGRSAAVSRFISLFYCEVEPGGTVVYCNAGHPPGLLYDGNGFTEMSRGGLVLGPNPDATYERGYVEMPPGSVLFAYTDGLSEAESPAGEMYGVSRIQATIAARRWRNAEELVDAVFAGATAHSGLDAPVDDQTAVAIVRGDETD